MVERQENFLNSRRSRMAKTVTFWTLVNLLIVPELKLSFFLYFFFSFATQKSWSGDGGGGGGMTPNPPLFPVT